MKAKNMQMKLALFSVMSLVLLMIIPVHADVNNATLDKETFTIDDKFTISGTVSDSERVMMVAAMKGPNGEKLNKNILSDPDGTFSFIPIDAGLIFSSKGEYRITIITENQRIENGTVIKIQYEKGIASVLPNYELILKENGNKNVDETKKLTFTASVTDSSIENLEYSLSNQPNGATIDKDSGIFTWTPTSSQSGNYILDIVVKSGILEDRETITITVNDKPAPEPAPEPAPKSDTKLGLAPFVDESKDPQSYVDRYHNEASYKIWFDDTYSQYSSIYQAVGLDEPLEIPAPFVDESKDPQSYVDRYHNEASYKIWFDDTYSQYSSIYQAVGLEIPEDQKIPEPVIEEPEFGECGEGTRLVDGVCSILEEPEFGECGEGTKLIKKTCTVIENIKVKPWWQFW